MATKLDLFGDMIKLDKAFVSGKDRVFVNDKMVFEGKLKRDEPVRFRSGDRDYSLQLKSSGAYFVEVYEDGHLVGSERFDATGKTGVTDAQTQANKAVQICAMIGMGIGLTIMLTLNQTTRGAVPGGAVGGAIGGGVGGALGGGIGHLIFGRGK